MGAYQSAQSKLLNSVSPNWWGTIELVPCTIQDNVNVVRIAPNGQRSVLLENKDMTDADFFIMGLGAALIAGMQHAILKG